MTKTLLSYDVGDLPAKTDRTRPQPPPTFETQLQALPPAVDLWLIRWYCETWSPYSGILAVPGS